MFRENIRYSEHSIRERVTMTTRLASLSAALVLSLVQVGQVHAETRLQEFDRAYQMMRPSIYSTPKKERLQEIKQLIQNMEGKWVVSDVSSSDIEKSSDQEVFASCYAQANNRELTSLLKIAPSGPYSFIATFLGWTIMSYTYVGGQFFRPIMKASDYLAVHSPKDKPPPPDTAYGIMSDRYQRDLRFVFMPLQDVLVMIDKNGSEILLRCPK